MAAMWLGMLVASALPQILYTEITGERAPSWLAAMQVAVLLTAAVAAQRMPRVASLAPALWWLVVMAAGWHLLIATVTASDLWNQWQHSVPWVVRGLAFQVLLALPTLLLLRTVARHQSRHTLRLVPGDSHAHARPGVYTLGTRPQWRRLGPLWALGITIGTVTAMTIALGPKLTDVKTLLVSLPVIVILAAANTVNEEIGFRNVPLALLPSALGTRQAVLLTSLMFGLAHFHGNPPGASGVALATFLGIFLAKSMTETGGSKWAYLVHWLQDVIIFSALTLAWTNL